MKAVVIGEPSEVTMEAIMAVYPRHKLIVNQYIERGDVIGIRPLGIEGIWVFSILGLRLSNL